MTCMTTLTRGRVRGALALAMVADVAQLGLIPVFAEGVLSPFNDALDLGIALVMLWLLGWHWALLPSFVAELVPALNLFPTWTAAVFFVTRGAPGSVPAGLALPGAQPPAALPEAEGGASGRQTPPPGRG